MFYLSFSDLKDQTDCKDQGCVFFYHTGTQVGEVVKSSSCFQGTARIFLLTKKNVVLADQKTGQVKASVPLLDLSSVSVSTQSDGFFALRLKEVMCNVLIIHCDTGST